MSKSIERVPQYLPLCTILSYIIRNKGYQGMQNTRGARVFSSISSPSRSRVCIYIYIYHDHTSIKNVWFISNNILNEIRCIIENANDVLRHRLSTPFDSPDFLRMASDAYAGPGWSTTRHDVDRSLHA